MATARMFISNLHERCISQETKCHTNANFLPLGVFGNDATEHGLVSFAPAVSMLINTLSCVALRLCKQMGG